ncbi:hypothetical protein [Gimesia fumaroli]|nr:hypothetical protein [Gimesia fumaroli]
MKNILTFLLTASVILSNSAHQTSTAAIEAPKPELSSAKQDTAPIWTIEISPAPGLDSYATREIHFPLDSKQTLAASTENSDDTIVIVPRAIPEVAAKPKCENCNRPQRRTRNRSAYCHSWPWSRRPYYANWQWSPAQYMYGDFIRSNWFGSPYPRHTFYYNGYRPSFRFGSLQFRGFGNYDRMYNPRIIPFGYQFTGSRGFYAALALAEQYGF